MKKSLVPTNIPYGSLLLRQIIAALTAEYPLLRQSVVGKSIAGQPLFVLSIGKGEREIFFAAAFHANEWITVPLVLKFLEDYARAVDENRDIAGLRAAQLFSDTRLFVMPMVNPDGVDLINGFLRGVLRENAACIAAQYPKIPFPQGWKANLLGTDLNLSFPAGWRLARRMKFAAGFTSPAPRDFVGYAPLSAPEAKAVYDFTLRQNFSLVLALHTQGREIYWNYENREPPMARHIGQLLSEASGYSLKTPPAFSSHAGYKDWFIKNYNRPGYTVECGIGENPLPLSSFPQIYRSVYPLLSAALASGVKF